MASMGLAGIRLDTRRLQEISRNLKRNTLDIVEELADKGVEYMRENARVDTGAMKASTYVVSQRRDDYQKASQEAKSRRPEAETEPHPKPSGDVYANIGPCVSYAVYNEFGTSRMAAQPFVVPGIERLGNEFNRGENWKDLIK